MDLFASEDGNEDEENIFVCAMTNHQGTPRLGDTVSVSSLDWHLAEHEVTDIYFRKCSNFSYCKLNNSQLIPLIIAV